MNVANATLDFLLQVYLIVFFGMFVASAVFGMAVASLLLARLL